MEKADGHKEQWKTVKLGDCCTIHGRIGFRGYTTDDLVEKGYGAITFSPSDIHDFKLNFDNCDYISWNKYEESPEIKVFNGDILFCKTASIGKCAIVENLKEKATINPQFVVLKDFVCNPKYLYYKLISYDFQTQVQGITGGSTIKTMSQEKLKLEPILFPVFPDGTHNLSAQRRIAAILSAADKVIEQTRQLIGKYKSIKQGMMEDLLKPKEGWKKVRLGEVGEIITGSTPTTTKLEYWDGEYSFYSPADFDDNVYCVKTDRTITSAGMKTGRPIQANSIMVACIASIGKIAINSTEGITNQQINTIIPYEDYDFLFLYYLLLFNAQKIKSKAAQTTIPILNKDDFSNLVFIIPDLPEQRRIAKILSGIDRKIEAEEKVLEKYTQIKKGLMEKLLNKN